MTTTDPVTITLPARVAARVLVAIRRDGIRHIQTGKDALGVELLASASAVLGDALAAPRNHRLLLERRHAVVAADEADFRAACRETDFHAVPCLITDRATARAACYVGFTVTPRARAELPDLGAVLAAVQTRTVAR